MSGRYLANENFPAASVAWIRDRGNDVVHAAESHQGASDDELLALALREDRVLLTFDRDFGNAVFHRLQPAARGIVLFRLKQQPPSVVLPFLESFFVAEPELDGYFTVASPGQFRQTKLPE